jgi:hypothetical protein
MQLPRLRSHRTARLWRASLPLVAAACLLMAGTAVWPGVAGARTVARGLADTTITSMTPADQAATLDEIHSQLGATYVRFFVSWAAAEPQQGVYDDARYLAGVASAVAQAHADGLKVIITFDGVPKWASASNHWVKGVYQPNDAMSRHYLGDFQAFCKDVAGQFTNEVYAYEVWNEPNLYLFLYPQATKADKYFGAHLYVQMLKSCSRGIRAASPGALVVAGATAPRGDDNAYAFSASPLRFARAIKAAKVGSYFDAYSHHPYMPGASPHLAPDAAPRDPSTTVTLRNLGSLLKLFPHKPFLLTEYGYQTQACQSFTGQHVNLTTQAKYLKQAYAYVARYSQVKLLMWYLLRDQRPAADPYLGFYTGLETASGTRKPAWYAFAGGNRLTMSASSPSPVASGTTLTLTGQLTCASVGVPGKPILVQRRLPGGSWTTLKTVNSAGATATSPGSYTASLRPKATAYYRVMWSGVVTSTTRYVKVH